MGREGQSEARKLMDAYMKDGKWYERIELVHAGSPAIPPEVGYRFYKKQRGYERKAQGRLSSPQRETNFEHCSATGIRRMLVHMMRMAVLHGAWERDGSRYRLKPKEKKNDSD